MEGSHLDLSEINHTVGLILHHFNAVEENINEIITLYFNPDKRETFMKIFLNGNIVGFGQKVKFLSNIEGFDKKIISFGGKYNWVVSTIRDLAALRNGFAHVNCSPTILIDFGPITKDTKKDDIEVKKLSAKCKLHVMNAQGVLQPKDIFEEFEKFFNLHSQIKDYLQQYIRDQKAIK